MRSYLHLLLAVGSLLYLGFLQPSYAEKSDDGPDANAKVWADYHKLDQQLTDTYQKILVGLDSAVAREKFTDAQNAWLKFREAQGVFAAEGAPDKATYKRLMATSFTETTEARLAELKKIKTATSVK